MKYIVKVTDYVYTRVEGNTQTYDNDNPNFVATFEFENVEDIYDYLKSFTRDFTFSLTLFDNWLCLSTYDEEGNTFIEYKDYQEYVDKIKLTWKDRPESFEDKRSNKDKKILF